MILRVEDSFRGSPLEFRRHLEKVRNELNELRPSVKTDGGKKYLNGYIWMLDDILKLDIWMIFLRDSNINAFKARIKSECQTAKEAFSISKAEFFEAQSVFLKAYSVEKRICSCFEDGYETDAQVRLRELKAEYDCAQYMFETDMYQHKLYLYILGILARPHGFFDKVREPDKNVKIY